MSDPSATALPAALYRAEQVRELDRIAIEELAIPGATLMERAGVAALEALRRAFPAARRLRIVCGPGNNGGDGLVAARHLHELGAQVAVLLLSPRGEDDPHLRQLVERRIQVKQLAGESGDLLADESAMSALDDALAGADVVLDAVLGTGRMYPGILDTLAEALFQNGNRVGAILTIDEAIRLMPNEVYFIEQRRRFTGQRSADDRPPPPGRRR